MTLLICTVGGQDLICAGLPKDRRGERTWAAEVLERYDELHPQLLLPIIGKALRYLAAQALTIDELILIGSDQPAPPASDARFWESDTCHTMSAIRRLLSDGSTDSAPIPPERISTWIINDSAGQGGDPSDYDQVLAFLERRLADLAATRPTGSAFLEVTGGTPAMTTGLLIAGTEAFGSRAELLSIHPRRPAPATLGTGRRLLAAPLRATLLSNAATCAYDAALRTFQAQQAAICDRLDPAAAATIAPLLAYAHARYNFDFRGARAALAGAPDGTAWDDDLAGLRAQVDAPDRLALLAEVLHGAEARYSGGLYADFLTQLVRFEENLLRRLCLERGAVFVSRDGGEDDDGSLVQRAWLRTQPFRLSRDRDEERDLANNRSVMRELLDLLARARGENLGDLPGAIDRLRPLVYLRNELTHSLDGVRRIDLARRFSGKHAPAEEADRIVPHLAMLYTRVAGQPVPPAPFVAINGLLERLLRTTAA
jgi:hypothetical protein